MGISDLYLESPDTTATRTIDIEETFRINPGSMRDAWSDESSCSFTTDELEDRMLKEAQDFLADNDEYDRYSGHPVLLRMIVLRELRRFADEEEVYTVSFSFF